MARRSTSYTTGQRDLSILVSTIPDSDILKRGEVAKTMIKSLAFIIWLTLCGILLRCCTLSYSSSDPHSTILDGPLGNFFLTNPIVIVCLFLGLLAGVMFAVSLIILYVRD